jgi:hypothetical protein
MSNRSSELDPSALNVAINRHSTSVWARADRDWYVEPSWCWTALAGAVPAVFGGSILDPACGGGTGLDWCRRRGLAATGSDIVDRGCDAFLMDFLKHDYPLTADAIVSNPPYSHVGQFALHALERAREHVALLVQLPFLCSQRRYKIFTGTPVSDVVILSRRPSMPPGDCPQRPRSGKEDYAWVVWRHGYEGAPVIHWSLPDLGPSEAWPKGETDG